METKEAVAAVFERQIKDFVCKMFQQGFDAADLASELPSAVLAVDSTTDGWNFELLGGRVVHVRLIAI